ncbi:head maturation protease, ClpP-related [Anaerosacchariphilus polymeriproducens]|uniref:ATP-dependent Clp protease proteolytic subunit n=1 Tax=Anaerosacchariphilus polymeriproducens TaxID=1812858 RepID=A0A371ARK5_9FIRM|nr:head maturation protease, ClpP-related [Anaerosacchariphilus polymeriproducens]RDU22203.1 Clp protease ClpP [Anaerosacchariphilus polymeriproducens]
MNKYYSMAVDEGTKAASIQIYGDITSFPWSESDVSSFNLSKEIEGLDVNTIEVYINSYGGEVSEGLAIYNSLKRHKAKIKTVCDGFACSIASVIFMAGDERVMSNASLLMIHNAWTYTAGNANDLRKAAEDLEVITQASIHAYMESVTISEEELKNLLDHESWLSANDALEKGFVTSVVGETKSDKVSQSAKRSVLNFVKAALEKEDAATDDEPEEPKKPEEEPGDKQEEEDDKEKEEDDKVTESKQRLNSFFHAILK